MGAYNGVETALHFGDPAAEWAALRTGCGLFAMAWRGKINVTGKDRTRWLHNMVTNNVRDLPVNRGNYNFVLNAQGRILGDMYIFNRGESLALDTDVTQVEPLVNTMKRFIIMDKVELTPIGEDLISLGLCGPKAEADSRQVRNQRCRNGSRWKYATLPLRVYPVDIDCRTREKSVWFEIWFDQAKAQDLLEPAGRSGSTTRGRGCAGNVARYTRHSHITARTSAIATCRRKPARRRSELYQRLLHRAGDRGTDSLARPRASHIYRL